MNRPESLWRKTEKLPRFEELKKDAETDVLVIGGGLCGLLIAHKLKEKGVSCILVEKDRIMSGVSGNTTAKITAQHGLIYHKLLKGMGKEKAGLYLKANLEALKKYRELSEETDCDFEEKDNFVFSTGSKRKLHDEMKALQILGYGAEFRKDLPLPLKTYGAVKFRNQAQFNPVKLAKGIAEKLEIYENTLVTEVAENYVRTKTSRIKAGKIIVATHFPFINNHGAFFMKMYQHRSYVTALENAVHYDGMYVDDRKKGMSFRNYGDLLLLGGGDHRTGKKGGNWQELRSFQKENYPDATEKYFWAAQDCMTLDGVPYIGLYSKNTPQMYAATGFNKWGMTGAMVASEVLTDLITKGDSEYAELLSPSRSIWKPQLLLNGLETTADFLLPTKKRCPHLGCALRWNSDEKSWDCPCHGSRFDEKGNVLDNPSNGNLG